MKRAEALRANSMRRRGGTEGERRKRKGRRRRRKRMEGTVDEGEEEGG